MYIVKNAIRDIVRSPGRTIIICLIVIAISAAACVALSIQQSAQTARVSAQNSLLIRGHIKTDRKYMMEALQNANTGNPEDSDTTSMDETLKSIRGLELEELQTYAEAQSVQRFYYYATVSLSGDNGLTPLNADDHSSVENAISEAIPARQQQPGGDPGPGPGGPGASLSVEDIMASINFGGDFVLYGYSSDEAMEEFNDGTCYITSGQAFQENTSQYECIISEELATYNSLGIGDTLILCNPVVKSERFSFVVTGIYKNTDTNSEMVTQAANDPANHILTSYTVLHDLTEKSKTYQDPASLTSLVTLDDGTTTEQLLREDGSVEVKGQAADDSNEITENENTLSETVIGTYVFDSIEAFDAFEGQARELGLSENYAVTSNDVAAYDASLIPLDNLSTYANTFLYIVLGIGAVILIGVNVFNIRERKYEIGALTAMGMRKSKVARKFILELTIVTFMGILIGSAIGAVVSTPVANLLLASQIEYEQSSSEKTNENFGRAVSNGAEKPHGGDVEGEVNYISTVSFAFDHVIVVKMMIIGALLALVSSATAISFVLRYNPLEILAERD